MIDWNILTPILKDFGKTLLTIVTAIVVVTIGGFLSVMVVALTNVFALFGVWFLVGMVTLVIIEYKNAKRLERYRG